MSTFTAQCPFCSSDVMIQSEYANQQMSCPVCQNIFIAPPAPDQESAPPMPPQQMPMPGTMQMPPAPMNMGPQGSPASRIQRTYTGRQYSGSSYRRRASSNINIGGLITLIVIIGVVGFGIYWLASEIFGDSETKSGLFTSEEDRVATLLNNTLIRQKFNEGGFFIYKPENSCSFVSADVNHTSGDKYSGTVVLSYKGRNFTRPIECTYTNDTLTYINVKLDYIANKEYALEDVYLLYDSLKRSNYSAFANWEIDSAYHHSNSLYYGDTRRLSISLKNTYSGEVVYHTFYIRQISIGNITYGTKNPYL